MSPRALSTSTSTRSLAGRRAAAPRVAARSAPAPLLRRRGSVVVVRAEEQKAELSGAEKVINSITSFLNNSPLAQGESGERWGRERAEEGGSISEDERGRD